MYVSLHSRVKKVQISIIFLFFVSNAATKRGLLAGKTLLNAEEIIMWFSFYPKGLIERY